MLYLPAGELLVGFLRPTISPNVPIDQGRNFASRTALIERLQNRTALAITGAGVGAWAGYPTWRQLVERLAGYARENLGAEVNVDNVLRNYRNPLHCVQRLGNFLGARLFANFIQTEFGILPGLLPPVLFTFIRLPFRHILTFNYENSVERAHAAIGQPCGSVSCNSRRDIARFLRDLDCLEYGRQVVHLHGVYSEEPHRLALTEDGYASLYDDTFFRNLLWFFATARRLVFFGFSFTDADVLDSFRHSARHVRDNGLCHSAVVGLRPEEDEGQRRTELRETYLIDPVFYPISINEGIEDHTACSELINGVAAEIGAGSPIEVPMESREHPREAVDAADVRRAEELTDRLINRADPGGPDVQS